MPAKQGDASPGDVGSRQGGAAILPEQEWKGKDVDTIYKGARICTLPEDNIQPTVSYQDQKVEGEPGMSFMAKIPWWHQANSHRHLDIAKESKALIVCWIMK